MITTLVEIASWLSNHLPRKNYALLNRGKKKRERENYKHPAIQASR